MTVPPGFPIQYRGPVLGIPPACPPQFRLRGYHPLWPAFPGGLTATVRALRWSHNTTFPLTHRKRVRFRLLRFRSPLLTVSLLISFPGGTKMFQFPPFPSPAGDTFGEVTLGHPRFIGCMLLPWAYRSLPRPSSALEPSHPLAGIYLFHSTRLIAHDAPRRSGDSRRLPGMGVMR
jgi:hypothetical protein